ncbi:MAG TPA: ATP-binding protein [Rubrivivax sp.]|nr:ATP-binding protein [Rubrivivax sp.]
MRHSSSTVRRSLVVLVIVAAVPTLIAATGALFYAYKEEQSEFRKGVTDTTRALALVVDREIARREAIALTLAGSPTLTRGDLRAFHEYASNIAPARDKVVTLQDLNGQQLVNTRLPFGSPLPMSRISKEREAAGPTATVVSNLYFAPVGKQFSFGVQVPVARDGSVRYYLSVAGFASGLQPIMHDQRLPEGWVASILDGKGVVVARNRDPERFVGQPTSPRLAAQLAQGAEGVFESTTIDGIPILATFSRSPGYGWTVVIGVPISRATAPLKVVAGFGALATLLLILTVWAALWTGRRLLGPVERLRAASEALGSGRPPDPAPTGLVEADQILASMHEAGHRISAANASLEARRQEAEAAAQALRTSNEMVQLATNASGLGLFTWFPESDAVIWHNDLPFEIFGLARDARPLNAKQFVTQFLLPDDAPEFERTLSRTLQEGLPFTFQGRIRRQPDGEVRWVQFMGQIEKAPHTNVRVVGTATDITQSKHTADALRDSEARLLQLANTIPNLAWMANADGWITWYNDRWYEYTGTTPQEMEGWGWQKVHDPATLPDVMVLWQKSISTGQPFEMTFPLLGKDGIFRPFFTRVAPLRDAAGTIKQWFGTNTDVSPLKKAEDELRRADRRKDEFLAMLAHELRNPLAPIRNAAELLRRAGSAEPRVVRAGEIIGRQVSHMSSLLDDLLDVSRITRGLVTLDKEVVELSEVVAAAVEQVRPLIESRRHALLLDLDERPAPVLASRLRMTQVMANLLDNAAKYSPPGGTVRVELRVLDGQVRVAVIDGGIGISEALLPHVFEPFTQAERGSARSEGGLGLGLAVVKGLVELQGGRVHAQSGGLGKGSRFAIELPLAGLDLAAAPRVPAETARRRDVSVDRRVLIVDDNADAADTLAVFLQDLGHHARCAYNGGEALDLIRKETFDVAFIDIGLPDMSGYELAAAIRSASPGKPRLVALSGYGQRRDRQDSSAAGFALHLVKPVEPDVLLDALTDSSAASSLAASGGPA